MAELTNQRPDGKRERIALRMRPEVKDMLDRAAALSGLSATAIATRAIEAAAREEIARHEVMGLDAEESRRFAEVLFNPPAPNEALQRAKSSHRHLVVASE